MNNNKITKNQKHAIEKLLDSSFITKQDGSYLITILSSFRQRNKRMEAYDNNE